MFLGITAHRNAKPVENYSDALAVLAKAQLTPTGRQRKQRPDGYPLGGHSKSVTWVRQNDDQSIAFTLYDTDVVTWHPDDSIVIENFGTVTTSGFAARFLPSGIWLNHTTTRNGVAGGHNSISYRTDDPQPHRDHHICTGYRTRWTRADSDIWLPDETTLDPMKFAVAVPGMARKLAKRFHLRDFEMWLSMAPQHLSIEHECWSLTHCVEALAQRDFRRAAEHLPLLKDTGAWGTTLKPLPISTRRWDEKVTMGSLAKLKLALLDWDNGLDTIEVKTLPRSEFDKHMKLVRELCGLGLDDHHWGPRT